jgi:hypothetical protein
VTGSVKDSHTSLPVTGATVTILDGGSAGKSAQSDAAGAFTIQDVAAGTTNLKASQSQYNDAMMTVTVPASSPVGFRLDSKIPVNTSVAPAGAPVVRGIYIVPSDKQEKDIYATRIEQALRGLQAWYRDQLGNGRTFVLASPPVGVVHTNHDVRWYQSDGTRDGYYNHGLADARAADPTWSQETLVVYVDADIVCGQSGAGTLGAAVMPSNDLRGLNSEPLVQICPTDSTVDVGFCRWVGGAGHELGHAFGLNHPAGCDNGGGCPQEPIMGLGYVTYPTVAALTDADKATLNASRFFVPFSPTPVPYCY